MKTYLLRVVRYLIFVAITFGVILTFMTLTGHSQITPDMYKVFFNSNQAIMLSCVMVVLIIIHPLISYVKRPLGLDVNTSREYVLAILDGYGYDIKSEDDEKIVFGYKSKLSKVLSPYDDAIIITKNTLPSNIEGNRKAVVRITLRIK